jgi:hypothetical protein
MRLYRSTAIAATLVLASIARAAEPEIPVVGMDDAGEVLEATVPVPKYVERLRGAVGSVRESTLPVLARHAGGPGWRLRTMVVGLGVNAEIGIGPILKVGATPRFRLAFSNSTDPVMP